MYIYDEFNFDNISPYLRYIHIDAAIDGRSDEYIIPWRRIYDYELILLVSGELEIETENDKYTLKGGDVHIMPPLLRHKRVGRDLIVLYSVHFDLFYTGKKDDFSALEVYSGPILALRNKSETMIKKGIEDDRVLMNRPLYTLNNFELPNKMAVSDLKSYVQILNETKDIFEAKKFGYELELKICVLKILKNIISDMHNEKVHQRLSKYDKKIITCIETIKKDFTHKINIDEMAVEAGFTPSYFRRLFKKITNKSPSEYIINLRIDQAIDYMKTGVYSISEISKKVGYDDVHYFSRLFKNKKGCSPTNFMI